MPLSFDDPKPPREKRKMQQISLLPSLKAQIDKQRGDKLNRSEWLEQAIIAKLKADAESTADP